MLLVAFWFLFQSGAEWASTAFYFFGLILGILLISQFWTLANEVYDPRQAKRMFGFIGGGSSLGGVGRLLARTASEDDRHDQPAAGERGDDDDLPPAGDADHHARAAGDTADH